MTGRARGAAARGATAALLALALGLAGGCATRNGANGAAEATRAPATAPAWNLEIDAPEPLAALLAQHLDIARFRLVPAGDAVTPAELDRLAATAPAQARTLLETEGYFAAVVRVRKLPPAGADALPLLRVEVEPGPQARVADVRLDVDGAPQTVGLLREEWPLKPGEPFRQAAWSEAKNRSLATLRAQGYPAATWAETEARVDAATHAVQLAARAKSGPLYRLGALRIEGLARHDASTVERLATFEPGAPALERTLLDFQERLQKVGLFEGASVELDADPAQSQAAPVIVRVREHPLQQATFGVGVSANTGPRVTLEHVHRKPFGLPWMAKNQIELGGDRRSWQLDLTSHPVPGLYRNLAAVGVEWLRTEDEVRRNARARIGRTQDTPAIERLYFGEYIRERLTNPAGTTQSDALSAHYQWVFRKVDSVLLPTDGRALSAEVAAGYARSDTRRDGPFARTQGRLTFWWPVGRNWYATARVEAGQVFANQETGVPDVLLFRAGGDESVRGYAYRSLGPTRDGALASGRALLTASAEIARPIWPDRPAIWGAAFIDAGNAADRFRDLHPVVGTGIGVRWRSPVGPLRLDLAYGHAVERLRLHLSVGIAF